MITSEYHEQFLQWRVWTYMVTTAVVNLARISNELFELTLSYYTAWLTSTYPKRACKSEIDNTS